MLYGYIFIPFFSVFSDNKKRTLLFLVPFEALRIPPFFLERMINNYDTYVVKC